MSKPTSVNVIREGDPTVCLECGKARADHGNASYRTGACHNFQPSYREVEYRPPGGDRGSHGAPFRTSVMRLVKNARGETVEMHTYHEAELRQLDNRGNIGFGLPRMQLVMPDHDPREGGFHDEVGDRYYRRRYLYFNPATLDVEGGGFIRLEGFSYGAPGHKRDDEGMSSYDSLGPDNTTLIRMESWHQYVPSEVDPE